MQSPSTGLMMTSWTCSLVYTASTPPTQAFNHSSQHEQHKHRTMIHRFAFRSNHEHFCKAGGWVVVVLLLLLVLQRGADRKVDSEMVKIQDKCFKTFFRLHLYCTFLQYVHDLFCMYISQVF